MIRPLSRCAALVLALAGALVLTGCATSPFAGIAVTSPSPVISGVPAGVPSVSLSPTGTHRSITMHMTLTSKQTSVHTVGPTAKTKYGWNELVGGTTLEGQPAEVELQANIWYVDGTGPFGAFLTVTTIDGSVLGIQASGHATRRTGSPNTDFVALLTVMGGTKAYANASGSGSWSGSRTDALGGAVVLDVTLDLTS